ncbi:chemotaxis response regulator protein-glutamate methylesterase [Candidatus Villigracilis saccharophilus]|uniref:protein-glutamate methylesterase/protein-glutamine glutaminase n=1 Tax=Candidatus Villigracilis saccharophilus TaxID=3140684 RepID=UPI003135437C|nr:chemotaxis response regulator protein-glutamate methylesterase [Anaerolineales bacterium]
MADKVVSQEITKSPNPVRVMVVDDSAFMRFAITQQLNADPDLQVVGTASNGKEALLLIPQMKPDVITLDVEMPHLDGLSTLREIMKNFPRPVIMFSSLTKEGAAETIQALMLGAVDFIAKPDNRLDIRSEMGDIAVKIKQAAKAKVKSTTAIASRKLPSDSPKSSKPEKPVRPYRKNTPVILIGSSTGGPGALNEIIPALPANLSSPVMIVQHMPSGFTRSLAERLNSISPLKVKEAEPGDQLMVGQILLAPGGFHMILDDNEQVVLNQKPTVHGVRPSVDVTLNSVIQRFGKNVVAVILTGMGSDGTLGAKILHSAGGHVIAEHESTCVVWGMPRSVVEAGAASEILPRPQIAKAIEAAIRDMVIN